MTSNLSDRHSTLSVGIKTNEQTITTLRRNQGRVPVRWGAIVLTFRGHDGGNRLTAEVSDGDEPPVTLQWILS